MHAMSSLAVFNQYAEQNNAHLFAAYQIGLLQQPMSGPEAAAH